MLTEFMARPASSARAHPAMRPVYALALMTALALTCIATVLMAYVLWPRWPAMTLAGDAPTLPITVAGVAFNLPPGAMGVPVQRRPGAHERVDLAFLWPSLDPPHLAGGSSSQAPAAAPTAAQEFDRIFVTIAVA